MFKPASQIFLIFSIYGAFNTQKDLILSYFVIKLSDLFFSVVLSAALGSQHEEVTVLLIFGSVHFKLEQQSDRSILVVSETIHKTLF